MCWKNKRRVVLLCFFSPRYWTDLESSCSFCYTDCVCVCSVTVYKTCLDREFGCSCSSTGLPEWLEHLF